MKDSTFTFGKRGSRVGIVSAPETDPLPVAAVVINSGRIHRVGPHRVYVRLARALAAEGFLTARIDLSGLGDSEPREDFRPLGECAVEEVAEAVEVLRERFGIERFVLMGNCAGAAVAFTALATDARLAGAVLMNINAYGTDDDTAELLARKAAEQFYVRRACLDPERWKKLFSGRSSYRRVASTVARKFLPASDQDKEFDREVARVGAELERLRQSGTRLLFVFTEGDASIDLYELMVGKLEADLKTSAILERRLMEGSDHLFSVREAQRELVDGVLVWMRGLQLDSGVDRQAVVQLEDEL